MSKRGAEYYLTDRNFNSYIDDEEDDEVGNTFKRASEEVLRKRKIKPLKRRSRALLKQHTDKPSSLSAFSFNGPSAATSTTSTISKPLSNTTTTTSNNNDEMKDKIKKFTEQICGLNESFVSFITKSIKEDIVFDISLNISQYQDKRKEIEKEYDDVIKYLTNNKSALKQETSSGFSFKPSTDSTSTTSKPAFSFNNSTEKTTENKPFSFGFGSAKTTNTTSTTDKPFTFNLNKDKEDKPAAPTFSFNNQDNKTTTAPTFSFNKQENKTTTAPTFSFNKQEDKTTTAPTFSFNKPDSKTGSTTAPSFSFSKPENSSKPASTFTFNLNKNDSSDNKTTPASSAPVFSFNKKPEDNKDDNTTTNKPTIPSFKPFTFNFGQKMANASSEDQGKTLPKPNFSFGIAPPSKAEMAAAAASNEDDEDEDDKTEQAQLTTGAGEEDEDTIFEVKAKIHHYSMEEKKYISRGVGLLKVNKNKNTNKSRLLGRMDNGTVFLNVSLFKEMVVSEPVNSNQFTFNAMDRLEGSDEIKMIRFAVRVKDKDSAKKII